MKLLSDVNVLLALAAECNGHHVAVRAWWEALPPQQVVHVCRPVQSGFLRLLCSEAAMGDDALTLPRAWSAYAHMLVSGRFAFALEPPGLDATWEKLCRPFGRSPKVVNDAYLAAFAMQGGYRLLTLDAAFGQFKGLTYERPALA